MQQSGMWGYVTDAIAKKVLKGRPNNYCILYHSFRTFLTASSVTPHSALLHVGLKSPVPSGRPRNIIDTISYHILNCSFPIPISRSASYSAASISCFEWANPACGKYSF
ncbi:hypothetical protein Barb7_02693 [Bacteroidales bacterium Barb7]|nr:hypothetical protein Barb7_02693 [Bacteroidales bacterium Barb7]